MDSLLPLVERYGYLLLVAVGFVEFIGIPIAASPFVVLAGALVVRGAMHPLAAIGSVVAGAWIADSVWFALACRHGGRLVERVCGLTSHPSACVVGVTGRVTRLGPPYVLVAKLLPGTGNLIAAAAGFAGMRAGTFLSLDAIGLVLWAVAYLTVGWVFAPHITHVVVLLSGVTRGAAAAIALLVVAAAAWRLIKARRHRVLHAAGSSVTSQSDTLPLPRPSGRGLITREIA